MFRNIYRGTAILTAERKALQNTNDQKYDWGSPPDVRVRWKETNQGRRAAHDRQRHKKGVLPADDVADSPEEQCSERANHESHGECGQVRDVSEGVVAGREEFWR